jgi:hypothetical protein
MSQNETDEFLRKLVLAELHGGLWHTTHPDRFNEILTRGAILPSTDNPDGWKTLAGESYCPYAHKLGGISFFDFAAFEPLSYGEKYPLSSWQTFVPYRKKWGCSVWIEIDREQISTDFKADPRIVIFGEFCCFYRLGIQISGVTMTWGNKLHGEAHTSARPASPYCRFFRYSSIARRISSLTVAPVFSES